MSAWNYFIIQPAAAKGNDLFQFGRDAALRRPNDITSTLFRGGRRSAPSLPLEMTNERIETMTLSSGATVALSEYGDPAGAPVFFCHGWPSSRTMAELTHEAARQLGARIISPDRPGIRDSPIQSGRLLTDWPSLLTEIADRLGIDRFRILAISGGAPYAYASGWLTPERIEKAKRDWREGRFAKVPGDEQEFIPLPE